MAHRDDRRVLPIHQSLVQPLLILGAERELVIISAIAAAMLIFSVGNAYFAVVGILFWLLTLTALQRLAKVDTQMSKTYVRHVRHRSYYPACAHSSASVRESIG
ncbi:MAG: VirB3 family type IV secretion system protein [Candidatus Eremiobacteraeota bacterium]|nr:VirB3 family type IV secretion system protein [Candidatus Eremiobacteraeota bacterium]MBC5826831.1 VirB3 family type IV secretion system protein [Candidatus Eremiobacteraeota bacterium]